MTSQLPCSNIKLCYKMATHLLIDFSLRSRLLQLYLSDSHLPTGRPLQYVSTRSFVKKQCSQLTDGDLYLILQGFEGFFHENIRKSFNLWSVITDIEKEFLCFMYQDRHVFHQPYVDFPANKHKNQCIIENTIYIENIIVSEVP